MRLLLVPSCASLLSAQSYTISTYAGGAPPPTPIQATAVPLKIQGIAAAGGNVYFTTANAVLQVDNTGLMTHLAGNGRAAGARLAALPVATSMPALNVQFNSAQGVSVDRAGNLSLADQTATNVWKLTPDGKMTVVAQATAGGWPNVAATATDPNGTLFLGNGIHVFRVGSEGSLTTLNGNGLVDDFGDLGIVTSIAVDASGNLYVATSYWGGDFDIFNAQVRVITPDGIIRAFAGTGVMGYSGDGGPAAAAQLGASCQVWVDRAGDVFIADTTNLALREVTPDGNISTVFTLTPNESVATVDDSGTPYLVEQPYVTNALVRRERDGSLTPIAGGGTYIGDGGAATAATLTGPSGIAVDAAHYVYFDDGGVWARVRKIAPDGIVTTIAGNGLPRKAGDDVLEGVPAVTAPLFCPCQGIAADRQGNVFFTEWDRVRKVTPDGILTTAAAVPALGLAFDGSALYIADWQESRVWKLGADGTLSAFAGNGTRGHSGDGGSALNAELQWPGDVAVDSKGNVYIAEYITYSGGWIRKGTPDGTIGTLTLDRDLNGIAVDGAGSVYALDYQVGAVRKFASDGSAATIAGGGGWGYTGDGGPATSAEMNGPARIAVDTAGNLFVADGGNNAIRMIAPQTPATPSTVSTLRSGASR